jgi:hypothetical protein
MVTFKTINIKKSNHIILNLTFKINIVFLWTFKYLINILAFLFNSLIYFENLLFLF